MHTRIKICGITRPQDLHDAVALGVDALGFVQYPKSPRHLDLVTLRHLSQQLPAFVTPVLLYVNADAAEIEAGLRAVPNATLQFHGDESPEACAQWGRPYMKAARIPDNGDFDLLKYVQDFSGAMAVLLDAKIEAFGGGGHRFNWAAFDWSQPQLNANTRLVLSGGLTPANVTDGIALVKPWAVDVSSGVENAKGIKDAAKMQAFVHAVRQAH